MIPISAFRVTLEEDAHRVMQYRWECLRGEPVQVVATHKYNLNDEISFLKSLLKWIDQHREPTEPPSLEIFQVLRPGVLEVISYVALQRVGLGGIPLRQDYVPHLTAIAANAEGVRCQFRDWLLEQHDPRGRIGANSGDKHQFGESQPLLKIRPAFSRNPESPVRTLTTPRNQQECGDSHVNRRTTEPVVDRPQELSGSRR